MTQRQHVRSIFVSDLHMGWRYSKTKELLKFLDAFEPENLYLVGDIIDCWEMKKWVYWTDECSYIVRHIIGMMKNGTKVFYIAGNHDEILRKFAPHAFGHLELVEEVIHETVDGRRLLVIHGDIFDTITIQSKWLYLLGDNVYSLAMFLNTCFNNIRRRLGFPYWSLSVILKRNVKKAVNYINNFEHYLAKYTKEKGCCGVICAHIHHAAIKEIEGIHYYNCGDWVESCTALIEYHDGRIEIFDSSQTELANTKESKNGRST